MTASKLVLTPESPIPYYYTGHWETKGILLAVQAQHRRYSLYTLEGDLVKVNIWVVGTKLFATYEDALRDARMRHKSLIGSCRRRLERLEVTAFPETHDRTAFINKSI